MKKEILVKSAIASAIVAATTVTTIADATVYGRFRGVVNCSDPAGGADTDCGVQNNSSRFGIKASHKINDGLTAFGKYEFGVNIDDNTGVSGRQAYVGLKGGFGEVSLGERITPMYSHVEGPFDSANFYGTGGAGVEQHIDFRRADTLNYKNKFGPASMHVMLGAADGDAGSDFLDSYEIAGSMKAGIVKLGLGYQDIKDVRSQWGIAATAPFGNHSVSVGYVDRSNDTGADSSGISLNGKIGLGGGKNIQIGYGETDVDGAGALDNDAVSVEYQHRMSKGFQWFAGMSQSDTGAAGDSKSKNYGAGIRYDF